jgi:hypothetical protein
VIARRLLPFGLAALLLGCPPDKPAEAAPTGPGAGQEGEPCAVGDKVNRTCGPGLACTPMSVAAFDPNEKQVLSHENGGCGGVGQIPCAQGLACLMNEDEALAADAMGICKTQSVCAPLAPVPDGS